MQYKCNRSCGWRLLGVLQQALVKYLDNVSDEDIPSLEIPTGVPLIYELDDNLKPIRHYYVGWAAQHTLTVMSLPAFDNCMLQLQKP